MDNNFNPVQSKEQETVKGHCLAQENILSVLSTVITHMLQMLMNMNF